MKFDLTQNSIEYDGEKLALFFNNSLDFFFLVI